MQNYQSLDKEDKQACKPLVQKIREFLYNESGDAEANAEMLEDGGLVINFGKGDEERHTVKVEKVG